MWANHADFCGLVAGIWQQQVSRNDQFILCKKLQMLKIPLRKLNEEHFSHISARAERAAQDLNDVQVRLQV